MNKSGSIFSGTGESDELFALQLRVARKADELAREKRVIQGLNLNCWLLAEAEVLAAHSLDVAGHSAPEACREVNPA